MTSSSFERVQWVDLWDGRRWPGRVRDGMPEFGFGMAPSGLSTRRQLRERGLCRGGQEPFGRLVWQRERRFAWLYVDERAKPKRTASDAQLAAVDKALAARKVCAECGPVDHFVRTTDQLCGDCHEAGVTPQPDEDATWRVLHQWQTDADSAGVPGDDSAATACGDETDDLASAVSRAGEAAARAEVQRVHSDANRGDTAQRRDELDRWTTDDAVALHDDQDDYAAVHALGAMEAGAA